MKFHDKEYFYKYVTADTAKLILKNLQVKYSSPILFNDPFDNQFFIHIDANDFRKVHESIYEKLVRDNKIHKNVPKQQFLKAVNFNKFKIMEHISLSQYYLNEGIKTLINNNKVFCISEKYDHLLMWAHYADNHKGAVVKFKCLPEKDNLLCAAEKVNYSMNIPSIEPDELISEFDSTTLAKKTMNAFLYTKSKEWEYEEEWRVVYPTNNNEAFNLINILEEEIDSIYLGCKMTEQHEQEILNIIKTERKNIRIFKASKSTKEFKLNFNELKL